MAHFLREDGYEDVSNSHLSDVKGPPRPNSKDPRFRGPPPPPPKRSMNPPSPLPTPSNRRAPRPSSR